MFGSVAVCVEYSIDFVKEVGILYGGCFYIRGVGVAE
jgi:hypothetical protein